MSLSVDEKLRVAHALDALGVALHRGRLPRLEPEGGGALRAARRARRSSTREIAAFGMTRRRDIAAEDDAGLRLLAESCAPVCTLVGKTWALHLEKVTKVVARGEPGDDRRLGRVPARRRASASIYDAEHFFDAFRDDPDYALQLPAGRRRRAAPRPSTLCDTNGSSLPDAVAAATAPWSSELGDSVRVGIHTHDDAGCGVANSLARRRARRAARCRAR